MKCVRLRATIEQQRISTNELVCSRRLVRVIYRDHIQRKDIISGLYDVTTLTLRQGKERLARLV